MRCYFLFIFLFFLLNNFSLYLTHRSKNVHIGKHTQTNRKLVSTVTQDGQLCCSYDYGCAGDLGSERSDESPGWQSGMHSLPYVAGDQPEVKSSTGGELSSSEGGISHDLGPTAAGVVNNQHQQASSHQLPEQAAAVVTGKVAATSVPSVA